MSFAHPENVSSARKSFRTILGLLPIALVGAAACGGNAFEYKNGVAGSTGLAGTSSAAGHSNATGGSGNAAGALPGTGGSSSGQAGSATGGAMSRGGTGSGVGGTGSGAAGSGAVDVSSCTANTQCAIVPVSCCSCGIIGPATDFTAINSAREAEFDKRCQMVDCGGCPPLRAPSPNDPYFYLVATCQRPAEAAPDAPGHCVVVDLKKTEITACTSASDCSLRSGTACCSGCSGTPVALDGKQAAALSDLVCPSGPIACPACAPIFDGYQAVCSDGRCAVEQSLN